MAGGSVHLFCHALENRMGNEISCLMVQLLKAQALMSCYHKHSRKEKRKRVRVALREFIYINYLALTLYTYYTFMYLHFIYNISPLALRISSHPPQNTHRLNPTTRSKPQELGRASLLTSSRAFTLVRRVPEKSTLQASVVNRSSRRDGCISDYEAALGNTGQRLAWSWEEAASSKSWTTGTQTWYVLLYSCI